MNDLIGLGLGFDSFPRGAELGTAKVGEAFHVKAPVVVHFGRGGAEESPVVEQKRFSADRSVDTSGETASIAEGAAGVIAS